MGVSGFTGISRVLSSERDASIDWRICVSDADSRTCVEWCEGVVLQSVFLSMNGDSFLVHTCPRLRAAVKFTRRL